MVAIRRIEKTDFHSWIKLRRQLWPDCPAGEHKNEMEMCTDNPTRFPVYGAFVKGTLVGFLEISIGSNDMMPEIPTVFYLEGLFVHPDYRGRGIARRLLEFSSTVAQAQGFEAVYSDTQVWNAVSAVVHERVGFTELKRTTTEVVFRKIL